MEDDCGIKNDPLELTQQYLDIQSELEAKIDAELKDQFRGFGFCHTYWRVKKKILKKDYGMKWESPADLNPNMCWD